MRTFVLTSKPEARPRKCDRTLYGPEGQASLSIWNNRTLIRPGDRYIHLKQGKLAGVVAVGKITSKAHRRIFAANPKLPGYFVNLDSNLALERRTPNAERQTPNAERQTPNAKRLPVPHPHRR